MIFCNLTLHPPERLRMDSIRAGGMGSSRADAFCWRAAGSLGRNCPQLILPNLMDTYRPNLGSPSLLVRLSTGAGPAVNPHEEDADLAKSVNCVSVFYQLSSLCGASNSPPQSLL